MASDSRWSRTDVGETKERERERERVGDVGPAYVRPAWDVDTAKPHPSILAAAAAAAALREIQTHARRSSADRQRARHVQCAGMMENLSAADLLYSVCRRRTGPSNPSSPTQHRLCAPSAAGVNSLSVSLSLSLSNRHQ